MKKKITSIELIIKTRRPTARAGRPILDKKRQSKLDPVGRRSKHKKKDFPARG